MTHDELVQFAAEKMGVSAFKNSGAAGGWVRKWDNETDWDRCFATELLAIESLVDITSPDLFFKGLAVCPHHVSIKAGPDIHSRYVFVLKESGKHWMKFYDKPSEIPQKFWECWAEVEGAVYLTKGD